MHIFIAIVAAGITLYLLRNAWERFQYRRANRMLYPHLYQSDGPGWGLATTLVAVFVLCAVGLLGIFPH